MIDVIACLNNQVASNCNPESISDIVTDKNNVLWVDVSNPIQEDMDTLKTEFGFHHLALEDALRQNQRTKLDEYPGYHFIVLHIFSYNKDAKEITSSELHMFIGSNYLVTVHKDSIPTLLSARDRWKQQSEMLQEGIGFLVYSLFDTIIDGYFPVLDIIDDKIDTIEESLLAEDGREKMSDIFPLRKNLLMLRRHVTPVRDILNIIVRRDQPLFSHQTLIYFQDVYDHLLRILDSIDLYRDMIASLVETHLATQSNQLNITMRTLTAMSIILMSISLICAIYGMNFKIPELQWSFGYLYSLGLMAAIGGTLWFFFWRKNWL